MAPKKALIPVGAEPQERSVNVAFGAFSCAFMPVASEGGPANWLKNKELLDHQRAYEPGGREFESLRARQFSQLLGRASTRLPGEEPGGRR
jgi:hypothetical protein